jgi:conjugal transfer pilus assembly protein TraV
MRKICFMVFIFGLSGCSLFGPKTVNGSFACSAPQGTCAPTLAIDDAAIQKIKMQAKEGKAVVVPGSVTVLGSGLGRTAKIIFPAYVDTMGRLHEQTVVHMPLNDGLPASSGATDVAGSVSSQSSKIDLVSYASGRAAIGLAKTGVAVEEAVSSSTASLPPGNVSPEVFTAPGNE